jgi:hypothetical protein
VANRLLRLLQGGLHAVVATLVGLHFRRRGGRSAGVVAGLPFLLWPYSAEAVLWRSAGQYVLAALLSVAAAEAVTRRRQGAAVALAATAVLTHQLAGTAGLVVWALGAVLAWPDARVPGRELRREIGALGGGLLLGSAASALLARLAQTATGIGLDQALGSARIALLWRLESLFLAGGLFYPAWLAGVQLALVALVPVAAVTGFGPATRVRAVAAGLALLALGLLLPYAPLVAVAVHDVDRRSFYLAPLALGAAFAFAERAGAQRRGLSAAAWLLLLALVAGYLPLARDAARGYVRLYEADLRLLADVERIAERHGTRRIRFLLEDAPRPANPHGLDFRRGGPLVSALLTEWSAPGFVRTRSPLVPEADADGACARRCGETPEPGALRFLPLASPSVICGCPP